jgi:hypothetical protein
MALKKGAWEILFDPILMQLTAVCLIVSKRAGCSKYAPKKGCNRGHAIALETWIRARGAHFFGYDAARLETDPGAC